MPALLDRRYQEVAAFIAALNRVQAEGVFLSVNGPQFTGYQGQLSAATRDYYGRAFEGIAAEGPEAAQDFARLRSLVNAGSISSAEAQAYLAQKYPDQQWAGGLFGDRRAATAAQQGANELERTPSDPDRPDAFQEAIRQQQASGSSPEFAPPRNGNARAPDELPDVYDQTEAQAVLESYATRTTASIEALRRGGIEFPAGSLSGNVLAPGSVPVSRLDPLDVEQLIERWPGPDQAIGLRIAPAPTIDRPFGGTGPGRVWRVAQVETTSGLSLTGAVRRYRILAEGMRFGISSLALHDDSPLEVRVDFGIVLTGMPTFGVPIERILGVEFTGQAPVAFASEEATLNGGPFRMYYSRTKRDYQDATPSFLEPFGPGGLMDPTQADADRCEGFRFGLIRGRTAEEVNLELNTRRTTYGRIWGADGVLSGVGIPSALQPRPLAPGQVLEWDNGVSFVGLSDSDDLDGRQRLVEGVPFSYADCGRLARTDTEFSVAISPVATRFFSPTTGNTWSSPAAWAERGLRARGDSTRSWNVDLLVM